MPPDSIPDEQLLGQIAAGDAPAFSALFRRRRAEIFRFALHMTGSTATAEDITQDVFMAVMHAARQFDARRATALAWLCGIARNHVRRRLERDRFLQPLGDATDVDRVAAQVSSGDPLGDLTRAERIETLRRAVISLPVRYREVVVLCDLQEMNYADAAHALGCAVGTVRSRLHRSRALLAEKMRSAERGQDVKLRSTRCFA